MKRGNLGLRGTSGCALEKKFDGLIWVAPGFSSPFLRRGAEKANEYWFNEGYGPDMYIRLDKIVEGIDLDCVAPYTVLYVVTYVDVGQETEEYTSETEAIQRVDSSALPVSSGQAIARFPPPIKAQSKPRRDAAGQPIGTVSRFRFMATPSEEATMIEHRFVCVDCGEEKIHVDSLTTGYGIDKQGAQGLLLLLREADSADMSATGRAVLYLTEEGPEGAVVSNWPGLRSFGSVTSAWVLTTLPVGAVDVWFTDSDGREWHGINYGHNSQLCHCRRLRVA